MSIAFIFPGQGSQSIGMGKEFYDNFQIAKDVFHEVDEALSYKLSKIIFEGPIEELSLTTNTQPALMAVSVAIARVMEAELGIFTTALSPKYVAGHSLGEYSALAAAKSFALSDTARLLNIRGSAMQKAVPVGSGTMLALLGASFEEAEEICKKSNINSAVCEIANDNCPGQIVLSGDTQGIENAKKIAAEMGKKAIPLQVSAPFHCSLIKSAGDEMEKALSNVTINNPIVPLIANVTASEVTDGSKIKPLLVQQVTSRVRWRESVDYMIQNGVTKFIEIGSGKVLSGLMKRIDKDKEAISINKPEDMNSLK